MNEQDPGHAVPINELKVPNILYKYRDYNNPLHKKVLDMEVYFPSANEFNDPLDSKTPFRYRPEDLTEDNLFKKNLEIAKRIKPGLEEPVYHKMAYENQKKNLLFDPQHVDKFDEQYYKELCDDYGIYCLTPNPINFLMWSYYANSHKGFCIGYDTNVLLGTGLFSMGGIVDYRNDFPKLPLFPTKTDHIFLNIFYTKWKIWIHEEEYRLIHIFKKGKKYILPNEAISEIIFGYLFPEKEKIKLTEMLVAKFPKISISQITLGTEEFCINKTSLINPSLLLDFKPAN